MNLSSHPARPCGTWQADLEISGKTIYSKCFGKTSANSDAGPMQLDSVMWIASMTKVSCIRELYGM